MNFVRNLLNVENENELRTLEFCEKEEVDEKFHEIFQVDDGTLFYKYHSTSFMEDTYGIKHDNLLRVKYQGQNVEVQLLSETSRVKACAYGNAIYCCECEGEKVYKCVFVDGKIIVSHARDLSKSAIVEVNDKGVVIEGKSDSNDIWTIYRIYDDPDRDAISVKLTKKEKHELTLEGVHRARAIFVKNDCGGFVYYSKPTVLKWDQSVIVIQKQGWSYKSWCFDSSPFIYMVSDYKTGCNILYLLDTRTMEFLPGLKLTLNEWPDISGIESIVHVSKEGVLTMHGRKHWDYILMTAQLPTEYIEGNSFFSEFLNKFEPLRVLGQGGFGIVFEARNLIDEWNYAVKRIAFRGSERKAKEALKEVRVLASLKHEGIVGYNSSWIEKPPKGWQKQSDAQLLKNLEYTDTVTYSDDYVFIYIQMELCKQSLADWLYDNPDRNLSQAKSWFKQLVSAVGYLHQENKIHRDLKPGNILFDVKGKLKLCDLGLAAEIELRSEQEIDITRSIAGTPMYMAPEQRSGRYDSKVDVYSLGLILAELCVCMTVYKAYRAFMLYQEGRKPTILSHLPEVDRFVDWLTRRDPSHRPICAEILAHKFLA